MQRTRLVGRCNVGEFSLGNGGELEYRPRFPEELASGGEKSNIDSKETETPTPYARDRTRPRNTGIRIVCFPTHFRYEIRVLSTPRKADRSLAMRAACTQDCCWVHVRYMSIRTARQHLARVLSRSRGSLGTLHAALARHRSRPEAGRDVLSSHLGSCFRDPSQST